MKKCINCIVLRINRIEEIHIISLLFSVGQNKLAIFDYARKILLFTQKVCKWQSLDTGTTTCFL